MRTKLSLVFFFLIVILSVKAQKNRSYHLGSPDGKIAVTIETGPAIIWSVKHESDQVIASSPISLTLAGGEVLGKNVVVSNAKTASVHTNFATPIYKKSSVVDHCNQLTLTCKNGYGIIFRAYDDGAAYRFFTMRKGDLTIVSEEADF